MCTHARTHAPHGVCSLTPHTSLLCWFLSDTVSCRLAFSVMQSMRPMMSPARSRYPVPPRGGARHTASERHVEWARAARAPRRWRSRRLLLGASNEVLLLPAEVLLMLAAAAARAPRVQRLGACHKLPSAGKSTTMATPLQQQHQQQPYEAVPASSPPPALAGREQPHLPPRCSFYLLSPTTEFPRSSYNLYECSHPARSRHTRRATLVPGRPGAAHGPVRASPLKAHQWTLGSLEVEPPPSAKPCPCGLGWKGAAALPMDWGAKGVAIAVVIGTVIGGGPAPRPVSRTPTRPGGVSGVVSGRLLACVSRSTVVSVCQGSGGAQTGESLRRGINDSEG